MKCCNFHCIEAASLLASDVGHSPDLQVCTVNIEPTATSPRDSAWIGCRWHVPAIIDVGCRGSRENDMV